MLDTAKTFLFEYKAIVILAIIVFLFAVFQWEKFKKLAYDLMSDAEKNAKEYLLHAGKDKEDWVVEKLYLLLPKPVSVFIPNIIMHRIIHFLFVKGKDWIDNGKLDDSYKDEEQQ